MAAWVPECRNEDISNYTQLQECLRTKKHLFQTMGIHGEVQVYLGIFIPRPTTKADQFLSAHSISYWEINDDGSKFTGFVASKSRSRLC